MFLVIAVLFLLIISLGFIQEPVSKGDRKAAMESFKQKYGNRWDVEWDYKTGTPSNIIGHRITKYGGTPEQIAMAFFSEEKRMLGIGNVNTDLVLTKTNYTPKGGTRLRFGQNYKSIPIIASGYLVAVGNDGGIYYVSGDYFPDVKVDTQPAVSPEAAKSIVRSDLSQLKIDKIAEPVLSIQVDNRNYNRQTYTLVYRELHVQSPQVTIGNIGWTRIRAA